MLLWEEINKEKEMTDKKILELDPQIESWHYKAYAEAIMDQLKNPKVKDVDLEKAAKVAGLPQTVDPQKLAESDGFNFVLDNIGLTDTFLAECLYDDIVAKPQNRLGELKLAAQMRGVAEKRKVDVGETNAENVGKAMDMMKEILTNAKEDSDKNIIDI